MNGQIFILVLVETIDWFSATDHNTFRETDVCYTGGLSGWFQLKRRVAVMLTVRLVT